MAGEDNQIKWVGVRPTNPPENIPVTESAPLTQIMVQPLAAGIEFNTRTRKRYPAIAEIGAIQSVVQFYDHFTTPSAGNYNRDSGVVPPGKLWVLNYFCSYNGDASSSLLHYIIEGTTEKAVINYAIGVTPYVALISSGVIVLDEGQKIRFGHYQVGITVILVSSFSGYQVDKY